MTGVHSAGERSGFCLMIRGALVSELIGTVSGLWVGESHLAFFSPKKKRQTCVFHTCVMMRMLGAGQPWVLQPPFQIPKKSK